VQEALNIVVVDDQPVVRDVIAELLEMEGHTAYPCSSGAEALAQLDTGKIDLLFTDLSMTEMSGVELIEHVLVRDILPKDRIVAVTGLHSESPDVVWLNSRKILVLFKPFDSATLRWTLKTVAATEP
jgi:CheY-like chemotaxis protein